MSFKSEFLRTLDERGFIHQCSDFAGLDAAGRDLPAPGVGDVPVPPHQQHLVLEGDDGRGEVGEPPLNQPSVPLGSVLLLQRNEHATVGVQSRYG